MNKLIMILMILATGHLFGEAACKICGGWGHASAYGRLFDPKKIETVSGEILSVSKIAPLDTEDYGVSFLLNTGKEELHIHLGPTWYIDSEPMKFEAGDKVEVKGSRILIEEEPVIVATEIRKGSATMTLRSESGQPVWSGWKK